MSVMESLSTAIMPKPRRSTFTIPKSAQSSLSHCTTTRPGILAGSSGTTESSWPWADHHAAAVLSQVPGHVLQPHTQVKVLGDSLLSKVEARLSEIALKGIFRASPFKAAHSRRDAI